MTFLKDNAGRTTLSAWVLFSVFSLVVCIICRNQFSIRISEYYFLWSKKSNFSKVIIGCCLLVSFCIALVAFYAALLPPHLIQEYDALNYHLSLPRQHLILNSFTHLTWSSADLFPLPIDFALAPYWFSTKLINKFPQFIFFLGLVAVSMRLVNQISKKTVLGSMIVMFAIFASSNIGIQLGLAMLDIVLCYLFIAAVDSFLTGAVFMAAIEFTFFFFAKAFLPVQVIVLFFAMACVFFLVKMKVFKNIGFGFRDNIDVLMICEYKRRGKKFFLIFLGLSLFIGMPFVSKSIAVSKTPLYPFFPGIMEGRNNFQKDFIFWDSLIERSTKLCTAKDSYGSGRSPLEFVKHLWLIAVPEKGVNNRYDYPVGLMYLLFVGPFLFFLINAIRKNHISILSLFIVFYWGTWWLGSQQTRFLYIPIILMYICVILKKSAVSKILLLMINFSLLIVLISLVRAHRPDFVKSRYDVLRPKDKQLIEMANTVKDYPVILDYPDVAYAPFPVEVRNSDSIFVLKN